MMCVLSVESVDCKFNGNKQEAQSGMLRGAVCNAYIDTLQKFVGPSFQRSDDRL